MTLYDEMQVRLDLRRAVEAAGGIPQFASTAGVAELAVSDVLNGNRAPLPSICKTLGYAPVVRYVREGER